MIFILIFIFILLFIWTMEKNTPPKNPTLSRDGYIVPKSKNDVLKNLPDGYVFLDYLYTIDGCPLATFHRDVTSSQSVFNTKYPVYTYIEYEYEGKTLALCPGSHRTVPFLWSRPVEMKCDKVLFNCDVVHAGVMNFEKKPRKCHQYKIAHVEDLPKLEHLSGISKTKIGDCSKRTNITTDLLLRKISLLFSYVINHKLTPYLQNRENNVICKIIGEERCFYNA